MQAMFVILDTTETFKSLLLDSPDFLSLHSFLSTNAATLVVPRLVIQETVNHFRKRLEDTRRKAESALRDLHHLIPSQAEVVLPEINVAEATEEYQENLHTRLKSLSAEIPDYGDIELAVLVERALQCRRPFDAKGHAGFRDAVLWETVLNLLRKKSDYAVIVTSNTNDFGLHGTLTQHLKEDLKTSGVKEDSLTVCAGLQKFVEDYVNPHREKLKQIENQIEEGGYKIFRPKVFFQRAHSDIERELYAERLSKGSAIRELRVIQLCEDYDNSWVDGVWHLNDEEMVVRMGFCGECEMEFVREAREGIGRMREEVVTESGTVIFFMQIIVKRQTGEVVCWEVSVVDINPLEWGWDDYGK
jgi:PIN domain